ncbi:response regulator [Desulfotalea psychrophila]|uniref:Related to two-component system response regulator (Che family) n=1 Tax=Desulfotalea psychrophila (strain LSv54 / DSM 12343) TaxID=177439 RepID=Q6AMZ1_DESPS|nr:response regulator [Desulfotalea psychrophila]CAG36283.1 related to two-component system response regulator (Che family) [Desulfotalea psychrophila LSv54]
MKILIIDDTRLSRMMLMKRMPEKIRNTATIIQGENGQEAVDLYREHSPDILFLDLTMPVMDGFEALTLIMAHDPQAIVYIVTADVQAKSKEKVVASGATEMEAKPISAERLTEILASLPESA